MGKVVSVKARRQRDRARSLRQAPTKAEAILWESLRGRRLDGWKWRRQVAVGPYIVDFLCGEAGLVVEVDGGAHVERQDYDARRTDYLIHAGLEVLRFWNGEILADRDRVLWTILSACREARGRRPRVPRFGRP